MKFSPLNARMASVALALLIVFWYGGAPFVPALLGALGGAVVSGWLMRKPKSAREGGGRGGRLIP